MDAIRAHINKEGMKKFTRKTASSTVFLTAFFIGLATCEQKRKSRKEEETNAELKGRPRDVDFLSTSPMIRS